MNLFIPKPIYHFLSIFIFFSSCKGQDKTSQKLSEPKAIPAEQPKIIKTQGTGPYDNVHCGLQDKAGNLWFGTTGEGVYRFDGKSFTNFTRKDGLSSNMVGAMSEDKNGTIWFGTDAGVSRYDPKQPISKAFTTVSITGNNFFSYDGKTKAGSQMAVWSIFQDKKGIIWFGTSNDGIYRYDGTFFTHFLHNDGVENKSNLRLNVVNSILEDKNGNIWFSTWFEGLCRYDGKSITNFKPNDEVWFATIFEDNKGNIWAGRRGKGVCRFDGKTFTNVSQKGIFDSCCVQAIKQDKVGNMWFGTEADAISKRETMGGVWRYDPSPLRTDSAPFKNFTTKDGLSNYSIFCIVEDRAGNLWFGTRGMGLCRYDPRRAVGKTFTNFSE
jgi:ligand-binding sensor domain-containing protein